jgi:membrane-associated phospholipid phosphatase
VTGQDSATDAAAVVGSARRSPAGAWVLGAGLTVAWVVLTWRVLQASPLVPPVDNALHDFAVQNRTPLTVDVAVAVSVLGQVDVALPLAAVGAFLAEKSVRPRGRLRAAALMAAVGGAGIAVGLLLNHVVGRQRPSPSDWAGAAGGSSFPSGHTTAATVAALLLAWAISRRVADRPALATAVWAVAALWAVGVGWSRVWLGVHWPTDVMAAWTFVPSLFVLARAAQLTWWPGDARSVPVLPQPQEARA